MVMVQMHMHARKDQAVIAMLNLCEFVSQITDMMVVHKRDGSDCLLVLIPLLPDKIVPNEIPQRL